MLRPGLYLMELEQTSGKGKDKYVSTFREVSLEQVRRINRLGRKDEKPFEVVAEVSSMNEKAYTLLGRPMIKNMVNETTADMGRTLHPLRAQRWFFSDYNPMMWPLPALVSAVRADRRPASEKNIYRRLEEKWSEIISGSLDMYRDLRDAGRESLFYCLYGSMVAFGATGLKGQSIPEPAVNPRDLPYVKEVLQSIDKGGYPEAVARIGALIGQYAGAIPLYRLEMADQFVRTDEILSKLSEDQIRRLRSEAGVMVLLEPERTLKALPLLLSNPDEREHVISLLQWGLTLEGLTREQREMGKTIIELLRKSESSAS
jgi:hypothetical protein